MTAADAEDGQAPSELPKPVTARLAAGGWPESGRFELALDSGDAAALPEGTPLKVSSPAGRSVVGRSAVCGEGKTGEVRLGLFDRRLLRVPVGEVVEVVAIDAPELARAELRVGFEQQLMASQRFESNLRNWLVNAAEVLTEGRLLQAKVAQGSGGSLVEVSSCHPDAGVVGPGTELQVSYVSQLELASGTGYDDVGGLEAQIKELNQYAYVPLHRPELYRQVGVTPPRGILLYGPPGTGKTHLARAAAGELGVHCISVSGPELVGTRYGETEASIRKLFQEAVQSSPAVIVIDEVDAIAPRRGASGAQADARIVTQILSLLDGLVALDGIVVLATTNRIEAVEPALRRPGRLDREIFVGPPDQSARESILKIHTRTMPMSALAREALPGIARKTPGFVGADLMALCREAALAAIDRLGAEAPPSGTPEVEVDAQDFEQALGIVQPTAIRKAVASFDAPRWSSVWGMRHVKEQLLEVAREALRPGSPLSGEGILLTGVSGSGKTVLAEGLAGELGANLVRLRGSDVFTKWLGESEEAVRETFELARHLRPTVIFLDNLDSLAPRRGRENPEMASQRVLNELLVELDNNSNEGILVVGATSLIGRVDEGVSRPGRLGVHIEIRSPSDRERLEIIEGYLKKFGADALPLPQAEDLVTRTDGWTPAELAMLVRLASSYQGSRGAGAGGERIRRLQSLVEELALQRTIEGSHDH